MERNQLIIYYAKRGKKLSDIARMFGNPKTGKHISRERVRQIVLKYG